MIEQLKPCPFCPEHGEPSLSYEGEGIATNPYEESWSIGCSNCGATPLSDWASKETAISKWNTRPTINPIGDKR